MIFNPGPNTTFTSFAAASSPMALPNSSPKASSQVFAIPAAVGKQVAGKEAFSPKWSPSPACFRKPCGPSDINMEGICKRGFSKLVHSDHPCSIAAFSSSDIFSIYAFTSISCLLFSFSFLFLCQICTPQTSHKSRIT